MKRALILVLFYLSQAIYLKAALLPPNDSTQTFRIITKARLIHLIDSVFDLEEPTPRDMDLLHYYASILKDNKCDTVRIGNLDLGDLSFYSKADEQLLFPPVKLEDIPLSQNLIAENSIFGFYNAPFKNVVTSNYGWRDGKMHKGIDIDLNRGDRVCAAFAGKVRIAKKQGGFGNVVILMHLNGLETVYAHLSRIKVKPGDIVQSGQIIGLGGNTGHSRGTHLHFEIRYKGYPLNPGAIISFTENKLYYHTITLKNNGRDLCAFPANSNLHKVKPGESWYVIAHRYGLSMKELMSLNAIDRRYKLKPGQQLRIN